MTSGLRRSYCDQDIRCVMGRSCGKSKDTEKAGSKKAKPWRRGLPLVGFFAQAVATVRPGLAGSVTEGPESRT